MVVMMEMRMMMVIMAETVVKSVVYCNEDDGYDAK